MERRSLLVFGDGLALSIAVWLSFWIRLESCFSALAGLGHGSSSALWGLDCSICPDRTVQSLNDFYQLALHRLADVASDCIRTISPAHHLPVVVGFCFGFTTGLIDSRDSC